MKTYILRDPKTVEPQNSFRPLREDPAVLATVEAILASSAASPHGPALFIGLDVHNDTIAVSLAPSDSTEVRRYGIIGGTHDDVLKLGKKLQAAHPVTQLRFCYSARERAGRFIAVRLESFSHGPGPARAAIRCAG